MSIVGFSRIVPDIGLASDPPRVVGRYELLGTLGIGGMATVYLAKAAGEAGFQRLFAVKVLHPHLAAEPGFIAMLLDEARLAARLHHPNIVPIVDLGTQDSTHYVVLDYVEGCSLSALLKKRRDDRPTRILVPLMLDAFAGLDAAHSMVDDDDTPMNLVHRDVSPQNVLIGIDGSARITDFGIARAESRINTTRPGQVKGKYAYMSPEQIRSPATIDRRSDVFSAGAVLWSTLTGRKLFQSENDAATMNNIVELEIPPPSTVGCKPPAGFDQVCLRALQRDPAKRFQTMQAMEEALREAASCNGGIASRREVAAWVTAVFSAELDARRAAIREAANGRLSRELPTFTPATRTPSSSHPSPATPVPDVQTRQDPSPAPVRPRRPENRRRRYALFAGIPVAFALIGWLVVRPFSHAHSTTAPAATIVDADVAGSTNVAPPAPATVSASAAAVPPIPTAAAGDPAPKPKPGAPTPNVSRTPVRATATVIRRKPVVATPKPATPEPPKPPSTWDKDSPLPPP